MRVLRCLAQTPINLGSMISAEDYFNACQKTNMKKKLSDCHKCNMQFFTQESVPNTEEPQKEPEYIIDFGEDSSEETTKTIVLLSKVHIQSDDWENLNLRLNNFKQCYLDSQSYIPGSARYLLSNTHDQLLELKITTQTLLASKAKTFFCSLPPNEQRTKYKLKNILDSDTLQLLFTINSAMLKLCEQPSTTRCSSLPFSCINDTPAPTAATMHSNTEPLSEWEQEIASQMLNEENQTPQLLSHFRSATGTTTRSQSLILYTYEDNQEIASQMLNEENATTQLLSHFRNTSESTANTQNDSPHTHEANQEIPSQMLNEEESSTLLLANLNKTTNTTPIPFDTILPNDIFDTPLEAADESSPAQTNTSTDSSDSEAPMFWVKKANKAQDIDAMLQEFAQEESQTRVKKSSQSIPIIQVDDNFIGTPSESSPEEIGTSTNSEEGEFQYDDIIDILLSNTSEITSPPINTSKTSEEGTYQLDAASMQWVNEEIDAILEKPPQAKPQEYTEKTQQHLKTNKPKITSIIDAEGQSAIACICNNISPERIYESNISSEEAHKALIKLYSQLPNQCKIDNKLHVPYIKLTIHTKKNTVMPEKFRVPASEPQEANTLDQRKGRYFYKIGLAHFDLEKNWLNFFAPLRQALESTQARSALLELFLNKMIHLLEETPTNQRNSTQSASHQKPKPHSSFSITNEVLLTLGINGFAKLTGTLLPSHKRSSNSSPTDAMNTLKSIITTYTQSEDSIAEPSEHKITFILQRCGVCSNGQKIFYEASKLQAIFDTTREKNNLQNIRLHIIKEYLTPELYMDKNTINIESLFPFQIPYISMQTKHMNRLSEKLYALTTIPPIKVKTMLLMKSDEYTYIPLIKLNILKKDYFFSDRNTQVFLRITVVHKERWLKLASMFNSLLKTEQSKRNFNIFLNELLKSTLNYDASNTNNLPDTLKKLTPNEKATIDNGFNIFCESWHFMQIASLMKLNTSIYDIDGASQLIDEALIYKEDKRVAKASIQGIGIATIFSPAFNECCQEILRILKNATSTPNTIEKNPSKRPRPPLIIKMAPTDPEDIDKKNHDSLNTEGASLHFINSKRAKLS